MRRARSGAPGFREQSSTDPRIALLKQLADPIRPRVIDRLGHAGPASVTRLADELSLPLPQLSNHLRRLREAGLVTAQRSGRQVIYALGDPGLELLTPLLDSITGRVDQGPQTAPRGITSRTCYDHLAGEIGVRIHRALRDREALTARADGIVEPGPNAPDVFRLLDVDPTLTPKGRQRLAFECLDATERAPHLAGAIGDAISTSLTDHRWIHREPDSRFYTLTPAGHTKLETALGIDDLPRLPSSG